MKEPSGSLSEPGNLPSGPALESLRQTLGHDVPDVVAQPLFELMRRVREQGVADGMAREGEESSDLLGSPWEVAAFRFSPPWWRALQRLLAFAALIVLVPIYVLVALAIRLNSPGPTFFCQVRRGFMGRPFVIRKFRTMARGKASEDALVVQVSDPKVTAVGRVLRFLKLDELPQMWNVVRGDMELVGPRPIPGNLERELIRELPGFRARYQASPGLTNLSQIAIDDNAVGFEGMLHDWQARLEGELVYLREKSVRSDVLIIGRTLSFLVRRFVRAFTARGPFGRSSSIGGAT